MLPTFTPHVPPRPRAWLRLPVGACIGLALAACQDAGPAQARADSVRGLALLPQYQCGACHVIPDVPGAAGRTGPTLAHFGRRSYIAGQAPNTPDNLQRWLQDPQALVPGSTMPALGVSPEAARDMAAYLLSLK
jgi:cytochrome c1